MIGFIKLGDRCSFILEMKVLKEILITVDSLLGDIQLFCENTGFMRKAGKELNAKLVFMEHRYYGKSIPDDKNLYLSAEQALADYAQYLVHLKSSGLGHERTICFIILICRCDWTRHRYGR